MEKMNLPPDATKKPYEMTEHGHTRVDNYYWMRLTDEQKSAEKFDSHAQEVVDYINSENDYTQSNLAHTKQFQKDLYHEIVGGSKRMTNRFHTWIMDTTIIPGTKKGRNMPSAAEKKDPWIEKKKFYWMKMCWQRATITLPLVVCPSVPITSGWPTVSIRLAEDDTQSTSKMYPLETSWIKPYLIPQAGWRGRMIIGRFFIPPKMKSHFYPKRFGAIKWVPMRPTMNWSIMKKTNPITPVCIDPNLVNTLSFITAVPL